MSSPGYTRLSQQAVERCYHCHECSAGCPAASAMDFGPDGILRLVELGQMERVLSGRDIWLCLGCGMCSAHCPNGIDVAECMIALRQIAAEQGYRGEDCEQIRERLARLDIAGSLPPGERPAGTFSVQMTCGRAVASCSPLAMLGHRSP